MNASKISSYINKWQHWGAIVIVSVAIQGCAHTGTDPEDMSADAHRATAAAEQQQAAEQRQQYDPDALVVSSYGLFDPYRLISTYSSESPYGIYGSYGADDLYWDVQSYNPTRQHLAAARQLESHAADHLAAAQALEIFEEGECGAFPPETRGTCPLLGQIESAEDVYGGVSLRFKEEVDINAALTHARCHLAFGRTRGRIGMNSCPLYVPGVEVTRQKKSNVVELTVDDQENLVILQQRVREHLGVELAD